MRRFKPPYPPEFPARVVDLVRSGRTLLSLSKEFGVTDTTIRSWVRQADLDRGRRTDGLTTEEKQELSRLRKEGRAAPQGARHPGKSRGLVRPRGGDAQEAFRFVRTSQAVHAAAVVCRVLGVSASGYHAWRTRPPSRRATEDAELIQRIKAIHAMSDGTYGAPRIRAELADVDGRQVGIRHIARLMRKAGIANVSRRRFCVTTTRDGAPASPDLVARKFDADGPNELWVADITYVPTSAGFLFLAVVIDVWSRKVVGWSMATHLRTELVLAAFDMAVTQRQPVGVVRHSDHGTQYTSIAFGQRCQQAGVRPSMGTVGDAYDNALCESFFASLECELLDRHAFQTHAEARMAVFRYIEGWYNPHRRHSALDYQSPVNYERKHLAAA
jgi:putative transposase